MIGEIALCVGAVAFAVLVGMLIPLLIQLRKSMVESERLLAGLNIEVPLLLKEVRAATGNMNSLIEHARGGVEHAAVLLHAVVRWVTPSNGSMRLYAAGAGHCWSLWPAWWLGFTATMAVVKAQIHREGEMVNGKGGLLNGR